MSQKHGQQHAAGSSAPRPESDERPPNEGSQAKAGMSAKGTDHIFADELVKLVGELLHSPDRRGEALQQLVHFHNSADDFGFLLWHTPGVMAALVQELTSLYPYLDMMTKESASRCCNVLAMLQGVATNEEVRLPFARSHIFVLVYPFLAIKSPHRENVRVTALGVFGALVRAGDPDVIEVLIQGDLFPLCMTSIDASVGLPATLATLVLQRILSDPAGIAFVCQNHDRFFSVLAVLSRVTQRVDSPRLARYTVQCYAQLAAHPIGRTALSQSMPLQLRDDSLLPLVSSDPELCATLKSLKTLAGAAPPPVASPSGGSDALADAAPGGAVPGSSVPTVTPPGLGAVSVGVGGLAMGGLSAGSMTMGGLGSAGGMGVGVMGGMGVGGMGVGGMGVGGLGGGMAFGAGMGGGGFGVMAAAGMALGGIGGMGLGAANMGSGIGMGGLGGGGAVGPGASSQGLGGNPGPAPPTTAALLQMGQLGNAPHKAVQPQQRGGQQV